MVPLLDFFRNTYMTVTLDSVSLGKGSSSLDSEIGGRGVVALCCPCSLLLSFLTFLLTSVIHLPTHNR